MIQVGLATKGIHFEFRVYKDFDIKTYIIKGGSPSEIKLETEFDVSKLSEAA